MLTGRDPSGASPFDPSWTSFLTKDVDNVFSFANVLICNMILSTDSIIIKLLNSIIDSVNHWEPGACADPESRRPSTAIEARLQCVFQTWKSYTMPMTSYTEAGQRHFELDADRGALLCAVS